MFLFYTRQKVAALTGLSLFHIAVIASSNYLVQLPVTIFGFHTTWGAFTFPFVFLATDLTVRIFGTQLARQIISLVMIPALLISYLVSTLFDQGSWQGVLILTEFNLIIARIAVASFMAYLLGQLLDIHVFNQLRQSSLWWLAPAASMFFGNFSDTLAFFFIAFHKSSDTFMATHWIEIALIDYIFKIIICMLFFIPTYRIVLNMLLKYVINQNDGLPLRQAN